MATPAPTSTAEAMDMVLAGLSFLADTDPTALAAQAQAECLQGLEQADAMSTAVRAWFLAAFTAGRGYSADADYSPTSWLIHRTGVTKGAARGHLGWAGRVITHPQVVAALAEGTVLSESMARIVCVWSGKLPAGCRRAADEILIAAARLVAAGLLPERAGQPVRVWAHVSLAELRALDDGSVLAREWIGEMAVRWAARRAAAAQAGSDGAAWLTGKPARPVACDAAVIPVVTGGIDPAALDDLVNLCLQYAGHGARCGPGHGAPRSGPAPAGQVEDPGLGCRLPSWPGPA